MPKSHTDPHEAGATACLSAQTHRPSTAAPEPGQPPCLDSATLLQGHGSVAITHRGAVYRLQATRQGKLILTK